MPDADLPSMGGWASDEPNSLEMRRRRSSKRRSKRKRMVDLSTRVAGV